tara:strand:+ start:2620 stop:3615 length:996 start_codon:yes stop_codon:yes gene_type:complete
MPLNAEIESVKKNFLTEIESLPKDKFLIDKFKNKYLGRKGLVSELLSKINNFKPEDRPDIGQKLNNLKIELSSVFDLKVSSLIQESNNNEIKSFDPTLPGIAPRIGSIHILEQTMNQIKDIFMSVGFHIAYGPEVDDDYHNFSALNIPEHHPARDMQDTFFIDSNTVLRTHTSNVQIHLMEKQSPPLRYIIPGRVYRNESISYKSYCLFHQVEGIYINKIVSFSELKGCLEYFVRQIFGEKRKMRFRPSYFPFTEPSAEVDIWDDDRKKWLEILGCGMVDPNVLENVGYDSKIWHGYAFGMGVERIAMLKYNINDIRLFYNGDIRFLEQFI